MRALSRLFRFLRPYRAWAILAPLFMTLEVSMDLIQPRLVQTIVDKGIGSTNLPLVIHLGLLMALIALVGMVAGSLCTVFSVLASQSYGTDLRHSVFGKVQSLSFANLDRLETGSLITRLTNDVTQVQDVVLTLLRILVRAPLMLVGSLVMAILTSTRLALLFIVLIPAVLLAVVWIIGRIFPLFGEVQRRLDALNTTLQENLSGVRVVKAFARSAYEIRRFGDANDRLMVQNTMAVRFGAITIPFMMVTLNAGVVGALWLGGYHVSRGNLSVGQVIAFINYLTQTLMSVMFVSMLVTQVARAGASAERIEEVLIAVPAVLPPSHPATFEPEGRIEFDDVTFGYNATEEPVLKGVSFAVEPGQTVAILGATGSGKTSLISLIPRFYDVDSGSVRIDGVDVREIDENELHENVGVALQESILFSGTIRDNIRYGRPEASDEEVFEAARLAQADEFIRSFPEGYETAVGQRGVNLSGGQKQRIAIARALLPNPKILIFDDSTSAVDVRTEARIQEELAQRPQTRLIVAQRISSVIGADKILVLENGAIAAQGTHDELLQSSPIYREIYESQTNQEVATFAAG